MSKVPAGTRLTVLERDDYACRRCGRSIRHYPHSIHHRKGRGSHDFPNLVLLCGTGSMGCHWEVHANPADSYEAGWMIRRLGQDDPRTVPIRTDGGELYLLPSGGSLLMSEEDA